MLPRFYFALCSFASLSVFDSPSPIPIVVYSFHSFKRLPADVQIDQLSVNGVALDLAYTVRSTEAVLFAYNNFYVELIVERYIDEILALKCFKSLKRLEPYLQQVDISEISVLLFCSR